MNPKELRIGNLFTDKSSIETIIKVESINSYGINGIIEDDLGELDKFWFQSIPLTEEWLLKFGFEKLGEERVIDGYDGGPFIIEYFEYTNGYHYTAGEGTRSGKPSKYVHQLQNLYFALTGQELTIKELTNQ